MRAEEPTMAMTVAPKVSDPATLQMSYLKSFVDYYEKNLAGLMVWVDTADNAYRQSVIPRAVDTPGLRFALAAFASHHGSKALHARREFHEFTRDAALSTIQHHLQVMNGKLNSGAELDSLADLADAEWMLAAIMIIASCETAKSQATLAEGHRMAARRLVNIFWPRVKGLNGLFPFLRNQFAIDDVLSSTTSFDLEHLKGTICPVGNGMFANYLTSVHEVTMLSRQGGSMTAKELRLKFSRARGETLLAAGKLDMTDDAKNALVRQAEVYHYTAVVYGYRCLGHAHMQNVDWQASIEALFEQLEAMDDATMYIQNLPWPVFIAGTESFGNLERQAVVKAWFDRIEGGTNFSHHENTRAFLDMFWQGSREDWQPLVQELQANGFRVLPV